MVSTFITSFFIQINTLQEDNANESSNYSEERTFIVHDSIVTESPSWMKYENLNTMQNHDSQSSDQSIFPSRFNPQVQQQDESCSVNDYDVSFNRSQLKKNQMTKLLPQFLNGIKIAQAIRSPKAEQMKENQDSNIKQLDQSNQLLDANQSTKIINQTYAMRFQNQTEQTRPLIISEQSSFCQIVKKSHFGYQTNKDSDKNYLKIEMTIPPKNLLKQFTHNLLETYKKIEKKTRKNKIRQSMSSSECKGVFGVVIQAIDLKQNNKVVAIKVLKDSKDCRDQALREIEMLKLLNMIDHEKGFIVRYIDSFKYKKRNFCLVFESLEMNLYQLLSLKRDKKDNNNYKQKGLKLEFVKIIAYQILVALSLMGMPNINIIHCDLKPENIMLKELGKTGIKIIDFGNACYSNQKMFKYIQSRYYRAPEIIMELPYSTQIDIWSLGCILYELHFDDVLFRSENTSNKFNQLEKIIEVKQEFPTQQMIENSPFKSDLRNLHLLSKIKQSGIGFENILKKKIQDDPDFQQFYKRNACEYNRFFNLLSLMLEYDPSKRLRPMEQELNDSQSIISDSDLASTPDDENNDSDSIEDEDLDRLDIANEIETMNQRSNRLIPLNQMSFGGKLNITNNQPFTYELNNLRRLGTIDQNEYEEALQRLQKDQVLQVNKEYTVHVNRDKNQIINFLMHTEQFNESSLIDGSDQKSQLQEDSLFNQNQADQFMELNANRLFPFTYLPPAPVPQQNLDQKNIGLRNNMFLRQNLDESSYDQNNSLSGIDDRSNSNSGYNVRDDTSMNYSNRLVTQNNQHQTRFQNYSAQNSFMITQQNAQNSRLTTFQNLLNDDTNNDQESRQKYHLMIANYQDQSLVKGQTINSPPSHVQTQSPFYSHNGASSNVKLKYSHLNNTDNNKNPCESFYTNLNVTDPFTTQAIMNNKKRQGDEAYQNNNDSSNVSQEFPQNINNQRNRIHNLQDSLENQSMESKYVPVVSARVNLHHNNQQLILDKSPVIQGISRTNTIDKGLDDLNPLLMLSTQQSKDYGRNLFLTRFRSNCASQKSFNNETNDPSPINCKYTISPINQQRRDDEADAQYDNDQINWGLSHAIKTLRIDNVLDSFKK
ncbi:dual specificity tyrosine-phosphorylation-regulated kinase 1a [Stylonychia lemnae]|uniref:Dual specificity tyrosine-phosphorylation-regulated kinase 1a n=1 Tax=Stylonychia lemnae TaxID=5949 RepID=A0A077ZR34_STYLE|nr:dual specificity tyrosine-phosphorylation-regulated kinase 1a [Stylonychia lemnae]|eukprot:CDW72352.1 dual specificity tyrosine-phosphorylation-regulated kinase 1a [Stylonychia lemnae]